MVNGVFLLKKGKKCNFSRFCHEKKKKSTRKQTSHGLHLGKWLYIAVSDVLSFPLSSIFFINAVKIVINVVALVYMDV